LEGRNCSLFQKLFNERQLTTFEVFKKYLGKLSLDKPTLLEKLPVFM
jgi:hypothetical protein